MDRRFAFLDRWQQSLRDVMSDRPERDGILALLEQRDRNLEAFLAAALQALDFAAGNPARARVYSSAVQSIPNNASTAATFDSTTYDKVPDDPTAFHLTSGDRLVCQPRHAGLYEIGGCGSFAANAVGFRDVSLRVNGATFIQTEREFAPTAGDTTRIAISTNYEFAAGDYVQLVLYQSSGGALNTATAGVMLPHLYWRKVADTA